MGCASRCTAASELGCFGGACAAAGERIDGGQVRGRERHERVLAERTPRLVAGL